MPDLTKLMQQAREMQSQLQQLQEELQRTTVTGSAGGGMVTVEADGKGNVRRVRIDPSVVNAQDVEMLEDLVAAAVSQAQQRAADAAQAAMRKMGWGLEAELPFKLPF
jgi:hypothetical protein